MSERTGQSTAEPHLLIEDLRISYGKPPRVHEAVKGVTLQIPRGEALGLIGESGSGKTSIAFSVVKYLVGGAVSGGQVRIDGRDMAAIEGRELAALRGGVISMVYQDPMSALNPLMTVGAQIAETLRQHMDLDPAGVRLRTAALLGEVRLPDPEQMMRRYPHQLSGGQQQRVLIAMALACNPELLIMDEPTTGLDVTTEAVILDLIADLRRRRGMSILFISHNLAVVAKVCDRVAVLRDGLIVEEGPVGQVMRQPKADYTRTLVAAAPRLHQIGEAPTPVAPDAPVVLAAEALRMTYAPSGGLWKGRGEAVRALDEVGLQLRAGETLAAVGESGSGKSTLARCLAGISDLDSGRIILDGEVLDPRGRRRSLQQRRAMQIIFQNPDSSLNPLQTIGEIVARPLHRYGLRRGRAAIRDRVVELLESVKLDATMLDRLPWQLSGGQKQRVSVARALAAEPRIIICDEPTSALDISVQARLLQELRHLQRASGIAYLFISHDLGVVNSIAHRVMVMQHGRVVETGPVERIFSAPQEDYTKRLIAAVPVLDQLDDTQSETVP